MTTSSQKLPPDLEPALQVVAARLATATRIGVVTGAGVSAASGVPTFRGPDGLWRHHRPEQLATPDAFARDPALVWQWYRARRRRIAACRPNRAHEVLAAWSHRYANLTLVTQNVDGLHERAGTRNVVRFHGGLWDVRCARHCPEAPPPWHEKTVGDDDPLPACPRCGGLARPDVVWFGEAIPPAVLDAARAAIRVDLFLSIGTSSIVQPAASLLREAHRLGALTVEINPEATPATDVVDVRLGAGAETVLEALEAILESAPS